MRASTNQNQDGPARVALTILQYDATREQLDLRFKHESMVLLGTSLVLTLIGMVLLGSATQSVSFKISQFLFSIGCVFAWCSIDRNLRRPNRTAEGGDKILMIFSTYWSMLYAIWFLYVIARLLDKLFILEHP